ncbi:hypothetical protein CPB86DRAFT_740377 [Serendipita vermifera]|nr:hypothetical protein CPB86DRAFT_740377 [Serendipita vermifera]
MNKRKSTEKGVQDRTQSFSLPARPAWIPTHTSSSAHIQEHTPGNLFPNLGYVHSGYQAAIQGTAHLVNQLHIRPPSTSAHSIQNLAGGLAVSKSTRHGPGGPVRCGYSDCLYSGFPRDVEIHRMDRHLIFPPGYKPQKGPPDGEIGSNMTIPGTGISLNTPEAINAWIAERKKNWPTEIRIAEKKKRERDALERGELDLVGRKRQRKDVPNGEFAKGSFGKRPRESHGRMHKVAKRVSESTKDSESSHQRNCQTRYMGLIISDEANGNESASDSDIDPERDVVSAKIQHDNHMTQNEAQNEDETSQEVPIPLIPHKKRQVKLPPVRPYNSLVDRPSFLRELLQPEIRNTVSNLSQAIRFIVSNDMFEGVELNPGDAEGVKIKEVE